MKKEKEVTQEVTEKVVEIPSEIKGVKLSEEQQVSLSAGEKIAISGMQRKGGGTFAALVSWDPEKARPRYEFPENKEQSQEFGMPHVIKGIELSEENKQKLQAGEKVFLTGMTAASGTLFDAYVYVDTENKKLAFDFPEKPKQAQEFRMPKVVKGVELSGENIQKLQAGEKVFLTGMTAASGKLFDAYVSVDSENKKLAFDFLEKPKHAQVFRMPKTVKGVELSQENKQKLESGEKIFLEGMTSTKGTLFSANVYVNREKGTLAFDFPEKEKNRQGEKKAVRETPLEKSIKKNGIKM
ncbi:MAG: DUF3945 domain-containing protein [Bacteroides sp.]|uniref:DUF3945 domain-containing protein n=1 Tax=Bacteroides sp. TaxID=29523 RepID=UPI002FCA60FE